MLKTCVSTAAGGLGLSLVLVAAQAQQGVPATGADAAITKENTKLFNSLDTNKDGLITRSDITPHPRLAKEWDLLDRNGDSELDAAEFGRFQPETGYEGQTRYPETPGER